MNQYLLCVNQDSEREAPAWQSELFKRGIVVMGVRSLAEALQYSRVYCVLMILLEIEEVECAEAEIRAALDGNAAMCPPVVGIMNGRPENGDLDRLAAAGLRDSITSDDPELFIMWRLDLLHRLNDLAHFEKSRMDVAELSRKTRTILHDMSQPLSAVQGRLHLLAAKCATEDPNLATYQELVRLTFDVTHQLMEIQQLHRQFS